MCYICERRRYCVMQGVNPVRSEHDSVCYITFRGCQVYIALGSLPGVNSVLQNVFVFVQEIKCLIMNFGHPLSYCVHCSLPLALVIVRISANGNL